MKDFLERILLSDTPLIDVRAPVEFEAGSIPNSVNLPILTNEERHEIGSLYKQAGKEQAMKRGHELVSGSIKDKRIEAWVDFIQNNNIIEIECIE